MIELSNHKNVSRKAHAMMEDHTEAAASDTDTALVSIAISLKRIANMLEKNDFGDKSGDRPAKGSGAAPASRATSKPRTTRSPRK